MNHIEAMKQALEALKTAQNNLASSKGSAHSFGYGELWDFYEYAATSLRLAIATEEYSATQAIAEAGKQSVEDELDRHAAALREQYLKQEPVAWRFKTGTFWNREPHWRYVLSLEGTEGLQGLEPLYTHPPKREPLTDEQVDTVIEQTEIAIGHAHNAWDMVDQRELVRAVLKAAHGIVKEQA